MDECLDLIQKTRYEDYPEDKSNVCTLCTKSFEYPYQLKKHFESGDKFGSKDGIGLVMGREIKGKKAAFMKRVIDSRAIFKIGGPLLAYSKGKMF